MTDDFRNERHDGFAGDAGGPEGRPGGAWGAVPQGGYNAPDYSGAPQPGRKGFFASLFDFSFRNFITIDFARFIYAALVVIGAVVWFIALIAGFAAFSDGFGAGLLAVIGAILGGAIVFLLHCIGSRLVIEFAVAMVRTAQNTTDLVDGRRR